MNPSLKTLLSPFVAASFVVLAVTGVLLFFDVENRAISLLHDWFGWVFVIAGLTHLLVNWRPLVAYLRQRLGALSLAGAVVLVFGLVWLSGLGSGRGHQGEHAERGHVESADD